MLALHTLATCDHKHRREVLAVADPATPSFEADTWEVPAAIADRLEGGFTTVSLDAAEAALLRADRSVSNYHSGQLIAGCRRARSRHLLLHDSDLVHTDPTFSDSPVTYLTDGWTDGLRRTTHLLRQFGEIVLDSAQ